MNSSSRTFVAQVLADRRSVALRMAGLALVYALLARIVLTFSTANGNATIFWIPGGLGLAALLVWGKKYWPGIFLGALAAGLLVDDPPWTSVSLALGNMLESLLGACLLQRIRGFDAALTKAEDFLKLSLVAALVSCVSALIGPATLLLSGYLVPQTIGHNVFHWWQADTLGIILGTPLALIWRRFPGRWFTRERIAETACFFLLAFWVGQTVFLGWFHDAVGRIAFGYWMFLFVVLAAVRYGRHGVLLIITMVAIQALLGAVKGVGYFGADIALSGLQNFWFYLLVLTVVGISLALSIHAREQVAEGLRQSETKFRSIIEASPVPLALNDEAQNITFLNTAFAQTFGYTRDDIPTLADWWPKAYPDPDYRRWVAATWQSRLERAKREGTVFEAMELDIRCKDGVTRTALVSAAALEKSFVGTHLVILYDITRRKQAEESLRNIEERLRISQAYGGIGIWENDLVDDRQYWSEAVTTILGFPGGETLGWEGFISAVHPDDRALVTEAHRAHIEDGQPYDVDYRIVDREGKARWMRSAGQAERDSSGKPVRMRGIVQDITARKQAEESLRLAALVYENSSEAMAVTQADGTILTVNPAFTRTTGYAAAEAIGRNPRILSSGRHDAAFYQAMWAAINTDGRWQGEIWNRRKDGEVYVEELTINTIFDDAGTPRRRVALFSDITQKKAAEEQLRRQANFDPLTGLPNRHMLYDRLEQEIKKSHRTHLPLGLMLLDLDRFKEVNDTLGHSMGDALLQEVARRLSGCVRETDTVARLGGDEFALILGELDNVGNVERIAEDILQKLAFPYALGEELAYVSSSIGITLYPADASELGQLLQNADQAMYAAKRAGRNRFSYFTLSMQEAAQTRLRLTNDLRIALAERQFHLHYQPIVELASGAVSKAEALIRWNHPAKGLISPAEFIPLAEDTGLIVEIGDWVFRTAAQQVKHWRTAHHAGFQVGVNKSPLQFKAANGAHPPWDSHLHALGLSGDSLVVEITEGLLMDATAAVNDRLLELRDAGIQVAVDDFGTGYSSLAYLKKFHIDYLKIDQSFTRNLAQDSNDLALCEAIIVMAHKLGLKVIAEGVETVAQRDLLVAIDCDYAQGYLFARPMPPEAFDAWLKGQKA